MKKENLIKILENIYSWLKEKGMNETLLKLILGALFGAICAFFFTSCSLHYQNKETLLKVELLTIEGDKK